MYQKIKDQNVARAIRQKIQNLSQGRELFSRAKSHQKFITLHLEAIYAEKPLKYGQRNIILATKGPEVWEELEKTIFLMLQKAPKQIKDPEMIMIVVHVGSITTNIKQKDMMPPGEYRLIFKALSATPRPKTW